jgi:hypothetical protein
MTNIKGSPSGKLNWIVYTAANPKTINGSEITSANTRIIYGLDPNRNILSYTPGQADFLQGFTSLENNKGYSVVGLSDFTVTGAVPTPDTPTTTTSSTTIAPTTAPTTTTTTTAAPTSTSSTTAAPTTTTTTTTFNEANFAPASVGATHQWTPRLGVNSLAGRVSALTDRIGTLNLTAPAAQQPALQADNPLINNKPSVNFVDSSANFLQGAESLTLPYSLFFVLKDNGANAFGRSFFNGVTTNLRIYQPARQPLYLFNGSAEKVTQKAIGTTNFAIVSLHFSSSNILIAAGGGTYENTTLPSTNLGGFTLGSDGGVNHANCSWAELIYLPGVYDASKHNFIGSGLASIYGLPWSNVS